MPWAGEGAGSPKMVDPVTDASTNIGSGSRDHLGKLVAEKGVVILFLLHRGPC